MKLFECQSCGAPATVARRAISARRAEGAAIVRRRDCPRVRPNHRRAQTARDAEECGGAPIEQRNVVRRAQPDPLERPVL